MDGTNSSLQADDGFVSGTPRLVFDAIHRHKTNTYLFEDKGLHRLDAEWMERLIWLPQKIIVEIASTNGPPIAICDIPKLNACEMIKA